MHSPKWRLSKSEIFSKPGSYLKNHIPSFSYFAMHAVVMDLFEFWWVVIEHIFFWHLIFIHKINYLVQQNSYHMLFGSPLDITTICIIFNMRRANGEIIFITTLTSKLIICKAYTTVFVCEKFHQNARSKIKKGILCHNIPIFLRKKIAKFWWKRKFENKSPHLDFAFSLVVVTSSFLLFREGC